MPNVIFYTLPDGRTLNQRDTAKVLGITMSALAKRRKLWPVADLCQRKRVYHRLHPLMPRGPAPPAGFHPAPPPPRTTEETARLRWCPTHQQAITHDATAGWYWMPFARGTLAYAQRFARAGRCTLSVQVVACWQCAQEETV